LFSHGEEASEFRRGEMCVCFAALENPLTEICWNFRNPNLFCHFTGPGQKWTRFYYNAPKTTILLFEGWGILSTPPFFQYYYSFSFKIFAYTKITQPNLQIYDNNVYFLDRKNLFYGLFKARRVRVRVQCIIFSYILQEV